MEDNYQVQNKSIFKRIYDKSIFGKENTLFYPKEKNYKTWKVIIYILGNLGWAFVSPLILVFMAFSCDSPTAAHCKKWSFNLLVTIFEYSPILFIVMAIVSAFFLFKKNNLLAYKFALVPFYFFLLTVLVLSIF